MGNIVALSDLSRGDAAVITALNVRGGMRRRVQDVGFVSGTRVECVGVSPLGDPSAYMVRGAVIALRSDDAAGIAVDIGPASR